MNSQHTITEAELDASKFPYEFQDLCEAACERKPGQGPVERMRELLQDLMRRHQGDDATQAALLAIEAYHLADVEELLQEVA